MSRGYSARETKQGAALSGYTKNDKPIFAYKDDKSSVLLKKSSEKAFKALPDFLKSEVALASRGSKYFDGTKDLPGGIKANPLSAAYIAAKQVGGPASVNKAIDAMVSAHPDLDKDQFKDFLTNGDDFIKKYGDGVGKVFADAVNQAIERAKTYDAADMGYSQVAVGGTRSSKYDEDSASLLSVRATNLGNDQFSIKATVKSFEMHNPDRWYLD
jgi:hypothetical protein